MGWRAGSLAVVSTPTSPEPTTDSAAAEVPFRYTAALAEQIELDWQDRWAELGTFHTPNPTGALVDGQGRNADPASRSFFVMDMFPYPSGAGLHVGHPLGYIATDVVGRYRRMCGDNVLHALAYDAFGLPAEQYAVQTGEHPRTSTEANIEIMRRQLRRLGLAHDPRRTFATIDPGYVRWTQWIFLKIFESWYDADAVRPDGGRGRARPVAELVAEYEAGTRVAAGRRGRRDLGGAGRGRAPSRGRRPAAGVRLEDPGQLVPGAGHRAGERGGHRRRPLRARQLSRCSSATCCSGTCGSPPTPTGWPTTST